MVFPWCFHGVPMVFPWFSRGFPMVFPWFSHGFPMVFPCSFSHGSSHHPPDPSSRCPNHRTLSDRVPRFLAVLLACTCLQLGAIGRMLRVHMRRPQDNIIMHHLPVVTQKIYQKRSESCLNRTKKMEVDPFLHCF